MKDLTTIVATARALLAQEDPSALPEEESARAVLRDLLVWLDTTPSPREHAQIVAMLADPARYLALPVVLQINPQVAGGIVQTSQGKMAVFQYLLAMPLNNLKASLILDASGQAANPANGMIPTLEGRWVLPRARVAAHVLQHIGLGAKDPASWASRFRPPPESP